MVYCTGNTVLLTWNPSQMTILVELLTKRTMLAMLAAANSGVNQASGSRFAMLTNADKETQIEPLMAQVFPKKS